MTWPTAQQTAAVDYILHVTVQRGKRYCLFFIIIITDVVLPDCESDKLSGASNNQFKIKSQNKQALSLT